MKAIELFAGAGGLGMGISRAGFQPAMVVERDRWCCDTLRENRLVQDSAVASWPEPTQADVRALDYRPHEGKVALVSGGPPCQPFSLGGRHAAHDDHRDMWPEAVRAVREARPAAFMFENVKGLTRQSFASYLSHILLQLQHPSLAPKAGEDWRDHFVRLQRHHTSSPNVEYRVVHALLNAADYGVPQRRERVVFVGFLDGLDADWAFPAPTHSLEALARDHSKAGTYWERHRVPTRERAVSTALAAKSMAPPLVASGLPWVTVRDALMGLPDPELELALDQAVANHRFQPGARAYPGHTGSLLDEPAKALKAGVHGVPGGENMLRRADGSVRYFTVRESARLQTFPDGYVLHGAWSEAMRQLGNAVPVTLAEVVARSIREHLAR